MAGEWERLELQAKCADLIGQDRKETRRDDGFHRNFRRDTRQACEAVLKMMREGLDRLTRAGI